MVINVTHIPWWPRVRNEHVVLKKLTLEPVFAKAVNVRKNNA